MSDTKERPEFATDEVLEYLDELRESGVTNMYGAAPYVEAEFDMTIKDARAVLTYWRHTFSERHKDESQ